MFTSRHRLRPGLWGGLLALCEVAGRDSGRQMMEQDDLLRAVQSVRRASREIGEARTGLVEVQELPESTGS